MHYNLVRTQIGYIAPRMYVYTPKDVLDEFVNDCGPNNALGKIVPNTIMKVSFREACRIHDLMYFLGQSIKDKCFSDSVFRINMRHAANCQTSNVFHRYAVYGCANIYYTAVTFLGDKSFNEKNIKYVKNAIPFYAYYHKQHYKPSLNYDDIGC